MECQQGQKKCSETKTFCFCFTAKSLKTEWNKNILQNLQNYCKLSETKTFCFCFTAKSQKTDWNKNILFLFQCKVTDNAVKQKHFFCFALCNSVSLKTNTISKRVFVSMSCVVSRNCQTFWPMAIRYGLRNSVPASRVILRSPCPCCHVGWPEGLKGPPWWS